MHAEESVRVPPVRLARGASWALGVMHRTQNRLTPSALLLLQLSTVNLARCLYAVAELRVADHLISGPKPVQTLAEEVGADQDALYRVMRALAGEGIFAETDDGCFRLTSLAQGLRSDLPDSMLPWVLYAGAPWQWQLWGSFLDSVRTGRSTYESVLGQPFFEWYETHPEMSAVFDGGMTSLSRPVNSAIASAYHFDEFPTVVDVGGGHGSLLTTILRTHPDIRGILFDQPDAIAGAREELQDEDVRSRMTLVDGDFFESVPAGGDLYVLKWVIHDWSDDDAVRILSSCRRAMAPGTKILLAESVVPPGNTASPSKVLDIAMLAFTSGRERTEAEYASLLTAGGFTPTRVLPTATLYSLVEGEAV